MISEATIQAEILSWLRSNNILHWRVPLGGVRHAGVGLKKSPMRGHPDIEGIIPNSQGRLFAIEVKKESKLSDIQKEVIGKLERAGVLVILAHNVSDVISLLDKT